MEIIPEGMPATAPAPQLLPRFADGTVNMQELIRSMAELLANEIMSAEADQLCEATGNCRNGYRERKLATCVGTLTLRIPKLRSGSFFPEDIIERYRRVDRAVVAAVGETCATGTSTRKVAKVAAAMGVDKLSKDQVSAMASSLDADAAELLGRDLSGLRMPYLWLDATYVKCGTGAHVASVAVVTAIGCDEDGWRHVLGLGVVDTEPYDSWLGFLQGLRARGVHGVELVTSDAHTGLRSAIAEVFQGAAWQRCVVHLIRNCAREAGRGSLSRRVARIVAPVFRAKDADTVRAMYHVACEMLEGCCPKAAAVLEEAEPDALAYLDFPQSHWKRLRANNVQERANREIKRRSRVVQVFPSEKSLLRLAGAVMCDQDEAWSEARYFSAAKMAELNDEQKPGPAEPPSAERREQVLAFARQAIEASLELADRMEAA
ncbi:MAG: IS256 family transposase [Eggerthellales bacterium]|nr:IS256 family transposase [Eggerthellales bacterium]